MSLSVRDMKVQTATGELIDLSLYFGEGPEVRF